MPFTYAHRGLYSYMSTGVNHYIYVSRFWRSRVISSIPYHGSSLMQGPTLAGRGTSPGVPTCSIYIAQIWGGWTAAAAQCAFEVWAEQTESVSVSCKRSLSLNRLPKNALMPLFWDAQLHISS